jgi:hypothetical protein
MLVDGASFLSILDALQINDSRQLQRFMTKALGHHFHIFNHMNVDEICKKIENLQTYVVDHSYPLTTEKKKKNSLAHNIKFLNTNLVQNIKGGCSPCPIFEEENTFR